MERILQVLALEPNSPVLGKESIVPFAILLVVILVVPTLFERLRLPTLVGLVFSGLVLGPSGWDIFPKESPMINLLSDIGLGYLMFVGGLEVEIKQLRRYKKPALGFSCFSFGIPLLLGTLIGRMWSFSWNSSILIGSLFASHTLLAYPIFRRLGVVNNQAVATTIAATVFSNIGAIIVLAVCVALAVKVFSLANILTLLLLLTIYSIVIWVCLDWFGKEFFRRSGDNEVNKFVFVLLSLFISLLCFQIIGIDQIFGAFLAGLVVNQAVGDGLVKEKLVFIGSVLFIPIFLIKVGLLIDMSNLIYNISTLKLTLFIIFSLIASKFIVAWLAKVVYRYNWEEMLTIWSLLLPQVGTTIAATFVAYRAELLTPAVLNSFMILMLVTSIVENLISSRTATALTTTPVSETVCSTFSAQKTPEIWNHSHIVVPIYNPQTQQYLIEMAAIIARQAQGRIIPLAIAPAAAQMNAPQLESSVHRSERMLVKAATQSQALGVEAQPLLRIDDASAPGISRAAREQKASLIIMGWGKRTGLRARLFGNVIDSVLWAAHCPVAVTKLVDSPQKIQRILVVVENLITPTLQPVQFAQMLAECNQAQVTVLNVCDRHTSSSKIAQRRSHLSLLVSQLAVANPPEVQIIAHENVAQAILQAARLYDLVVLPFTPNLTSPSGLAISDVTTQLASQLTCSIVMISEPQRLPTAMIIPTLINKTAKV